MGKRTRTDSASDYESIAQKFKKLERKFMRARRKHRDVLQTQSGASSSSDSSSSSSESSSQNLQASPESYRRQGHVTFPMQEPLALEDVPLRNYEPQPSTRTAADSQPWPSAEYIPHANSAATSQPRWLDSHTAGVVPAAPTAVPTAAASTRPAPGVHNNTPPAEKLTSDGDQRLEVPHLDNDLLQILGDDPSQVKIYGADVQSDLALRLQHICTNGLSKESRKELLHKYLIPNNCMLTDAPLLNPETKYAVTETVLKRDRGIEQKQKQLASAISCVAQALTSLLTSESKDTTNIKVLMDASKLLCDNQYSDTVTRRNFVLYNLKKDMKDQLQTTKIDKYLFGKELADTLKAAKAISKSGADMKIITKKPTKPHNKPNLNWKTLPQNNRQKGIPRVKEPAYKDKLRRADNSSKQSSRPASSRSRR